MKQAGGSHSNGRATWRRYWLFQIPGAVAAGLALAALVRWQWIEPATAFGGLGFWLAKDLALYPLVRRAYEKTAPTFAAKLVGRTGWARKELAPTGYVAIDGELWRARVVEGIQRIEAGTEIVVSAYEDNRLIVRLAQGAERSRST